VHDDTHLVVMVSIGPDQAQVASLKDIVAKTARAIHELSIFVAIGTSATHFVWAAPPTGEAPR
jgi:hypothetical protein